jgi:thiamine-phosphate pyrophosphorylase
LIVITDWSRGVSSLLDRLEPVLTLGSRIAVQHRHPAVPLRQFLEEGRELAKRCAEHRVPLFVNGRLDIALLLGAHLHLPSSGFLPADVRPHLPGRWISCAVHSLVEAEKSAAADLALVSPVFVPGSKPDDTRPPLGVDGFRALAKVLGPAAYALGGIHSGNAGQVPATGFATVTGVLDAPSPLAAAEALLRVPAVL